MGRIKSKIRISRLRKRRSKAHRADGQALVVFDRQQNMRRLATICDEHRAPRAPPSWRRRYPDRIRDWLG